MSDYREKLDRVLDRMGGVYCLKDILERIGDGRMQSFANGNSWLVTEINQFPRARTLDWIVAVGDLEDCQKLHDDALRFAERLDIPLIRAYGRRGWIKLAERNGWRLRTVNQVYYKEM